MDRAGISGALVCHGIAKDGNPVLGTNLLAQELKKYPRFYGCYIIASPQHLLEIMEREDVLYVQLDGGWLYI